MKLDHDKNDFNQIQSSYNTMKVLIDHADDLS